MRRFGARLENQSLSENSGKRVFAPHQTSPLLAVSRFLGISRDARADSTAGNGRAQAAGRIKELEQRMYQHARDLEFEEAARVRDQIRKLKEASLAG